MKCENIWMTRHGVRITQLPASVPRSNEPYDGPAYDAPLPPMGRQQAEALAERMADVPLDFIFSSPFRRTIQTVVPLARRHGLPIKLEWGLFEGLQEDWFPSFPKLPTLEERHREFPEVDLSYRSFVMPEYPETREQLWQRTAQAVTALTQNYGPNIFIVGHGASTLGVRRALLGPDTPFKVDFCGVSHLSRENGKWLYLLDSCTKHLVEKELYVPQPVA